MLLFMLLCNEKAQNLEFFVVDNMMKFQSKINKFY